MLRLIRRAVAVGARLLLVAAYVLYALAYSASPKAEAAGGVHSIYNLINLLEAVGRPVASSLPPSRS